MTQNGAPEFERRRMTLFTRVPLRGNQRTSGDGRTRATDPRLTPRQRQVLDGLIRGLANKEIAAELGIGPDAVKRVISRLLVKLDAPSRTALVRPALQTDAARRRQARGPSALSLLDAVPVPALVTRGPEHHVEYANAATGAVLADASPGIPLAELLPPASRAAVVRLANESFAAASARVARKVALHDLTRPGTRWRVADVFANPIYDGAGKVAGLVVCLVDESNEPTAGVRPSHGGGRERPA